MADGANIRIEMTAEQYAALLKHLRGTVTDSYSPLGFAYNAVLLGVPVDA